ACCWSRGRALMARREAAPAGGRALAARRRLVPLTGADVAWALGCTLAVVLLTGGDRGGGARCGPCVRRWAVVPARLGGLASALALAGVAALLLSNILGGEL